MHVWLVILPPRCHLSMGLCLYSMRMIQSSRLPLVFAQNCI